jgi:hypothetical protein
MPIAQAWKAFDEKGAPQQYELNEQLRALGREVTRGSCQFALEPPTKQDALRAEAEVAPLNDDEALRSNAD